MKAIKTNIEGCYVIEAFKAMDERGVFVKNYNSNDFERMGISVEWKETYYSKSKKNVIRGMHFQLPPHDHDKLVCCIDGKALDVVVDVRKNSKTFGKYFSIELDSEEGVCIFISRGMAHGFMSLKDNTIMEYKVTSGYAAESDSGIKWDSFGFDWKCDKPIISARDNLHPKLSEIKSIF